MEKELLEMNQVHDKDMKNWEDTNQILQQQYKNDLERLREDLTEKFENEKNQII